MAANGPYLNQFEDGPDSEGDRLLAKEALKVASVFSILYASKHAKEWRGVVAAAVTYGLNVAHAIVRKDVPPTPVSVTADKVVTAIALRAAWKHDLASKPHLMAIAARHAANSAITAVDALEPRIDGLNAHNHVGYFMETTGILTSAIGAQLRDEYPVAGRGLRWAGSLIMTVGLLNDGLPATGELMAKLADQPASDHTNNNYQSLSLS